ncbi:hypothetical protein EDB85DRAFT_1894262 [Lactarius pseudohatsudake]|nr:hypothetical protein EDB85DRAFT_1894262 [Lactarius pseudohatsudake]
MNRKKTGTGPDCNRLQPDRRLRFIRLVNLTGCGSSKSGIWVNRHRAGWDRSQPVFTTTTTPVSTTTPMSLRPRIRHRADCSADTDTNDLRPQQQHPRQHRLGQPRLRLRPLRHRQRLIDNHDNPQQSTTTTTSKTTTPTAATTTCPQQWHIDSRTIDNHPSTTATAATAIHQQSPRRPRRPRRRHIDGRKNDTSTAARHRQPQERQTDIINTSNHGDGLKNNISTTTMMTHQQHRHLDNHDDDGRQLESTIGRLAFTTSSSSRRGP